MSASMQLRTPLLAILGLLPAVALFWWQTQSEVDQPLPAQHVRLQVDTHQGQRDFVLHAPSSCDPKQPSPLVIMLHGRRHGADSGQRNRMVGEERQGIVPGRQAQRSPEGNRSDLGIFSGSPSHWNARGPVGFRQLPSTRSQSSAGAPSLRTNRASSLATVRAKPACSTLCSTSGNDL